MSGWCPIAEILSEVYDLFYDELQEHVGKCPDCESQLDLIKQMHRLSPDTRREEFTPISEECLDEEKIEALAKGTLPSTTATRLRLHISKCPRCLGAVLERGSDQETQDRTVSARARLHRARQLLPLRDVQLFRDNSLVEIEGMEWTRESEGFAADIFAVREPGSYHATFRGEASAPVEIAGSVSEPDAISPEVPTSAVRLAVDVDNSDEYLCLLRIQFPRNLLAAQTEFQEEVATNIPVVSRLLKGGLSPHGYDVTRALESAASRSPLPEDLHERLQKAPVRGLVERLLPAKSSAAKRLLDAEFDTMYRLVSTNRNLALKAQYHECFETPRAWLSLAEGTPADRRLAEALVVAFNLISPLVSATTSDPHFGAILAVLGAAAQSLVDRKYPRQLVRKGETLLTECLQASASDA